MTPPVLTLASGRTRAGTTTLTYNLAWMLRDLELRVLAADLDPQGDLTAQLLGESRLGHLWPPRPARPTALEVLRPVLEETDDVPDPPFREVEERLALLPGDLGLLELEEELAGAWLSCLDGDARAFATNSAPWRTVRVAAEAFSADVVVVDVGPGTGALRRAGLLACDHVVFPVSPEMAAEQALRGQGRMLSALRAAWQERLARKPDSDPALPGGAMAPAGYAVYRDQLRLYRPWVPGRQEFGWVPAAYRQGVLGEQDGAAQSLDDDPDCLGFFQRCWPLLEMAIAAGKPIFHLKPADGLSAGDMPTLHGIYRDFAAFARALADRMGLELP